MSLLQKIIRKFNYPIDQNWELIYAKTWDDTRKGIDWMNNVSSVSPGRYAVGYNYLYVMTRILNEFCPHHVLDIGLGISSTLISAYFTAQNYNDGKHTIIEHDINWKDFYTRNHSLSDASEIVIANCIKKTMNNIEYNAYENFKDLINTRGGYSVISVDAPKGGFSKYSRRDILDIIPESLERSFVIVVDDTERDGEKNTITDIEAILKNNHIEYCKGEYLGCSHCSVIASDDNKFFCTL